MSREESKARVSKPKSREPIARDSADLLAKVPRKKPPAPSVRERQKRITRKDPGEPLTFCESKVFASSRE